MVALMKKLNLMALERSVGTKEPRRFVSHLMKTITDYVVFEVTKPLTACP